MSRYIVNIAFEHFADRNFAFGMQFPLDSITRIPDRAALRSICMDVVLLRADCDRATGFLDCCDWL